MRMAGPDVVLFFAGLLLFSGSAYGLWVTGGLSGGGTSPFNAFTLDWASSEETQSLATFETVPEQAFTLEWNETGATQIVFTISCSLAQPVPGVTVTMDVELTTPNGTAEPVSGTCGTPLEIPFVFDEAPENGGTVQAPDADSAQRDAAASLGRAGVGTYSGVVRFTSQNAIPVPVPVQVDYSGEIAAVVTTWSATATPLVR